MYALMLCTTLSGGHVHECYPILGEDYRQLKGQCEIDLGLARGFAKDDPKKYAQSDGTPMEGSGVSKDGSYTWSRTLVCEAKP